MKHTYLQINQEYAPRNTRCETILIFLLKDTKSVVFQGYLRLFFLSRQVQSTEEI